MGEVALVVGMMAIPALLLAVSLVTLAWALLRSTTRRCQRDIAIKRLEVEAMEQAELAAVVARLDTLRADLETLRTVMGQAQDRIAALERRDALTTSTGGGRRARGRAMGGST